MRILGMLVGFIIGATMGAWWLALLLAGVGAYALPKLVHGQPGARPSGDKNHPLADEAWHANELLQARVAHLEQRVATLEARLETAAAPAQAAAPKVSAAARPVTKASMTTTPPKATVDPTSMVLEPWPVPAPKPLPDFEPIVMADFVAPPIAPPAAPSATAPAAAGLGLELAPLPELSLTPIVATTPPIATPDTAAPAPAPAAPLPFAPPKPARPKMAVQPPAPPLPLRERLPAPVANLIFGGNMMVKMGALILFLGLAFLLRYTAERVTVPLELRYMAVALAGAGLLAVGWLLRRKREDYALVLQGAGIGVFYLTTLAAMKMHTLLPPTVGFGFLLAVAVLSAVLAVAQRAPVLAIVAALEGFAAPVLASTGQNNPVGLFTYLLVLDVGIFLVAWFQAWRVLNLIGAVGTFTLAAGWAQRSYTHDQFGVVQPFLIAFFLLFTAIGLLFARRTLRDAVVDATQSLSERAADTLRLVGRVDSTLVFGVPMAAFGMQYLMVRPWEMGAAYAAMGFAAVYLLLARVVFATQPRGLALLAEAYAIVGVIFGTLAIPLALEGRWTGAAWAIEAAGMYWLGVRQSRPYARAFSWLVFAGAVFKLLQATAVDGAPGHALLEGSFIGPLLVALGALTMWRMHRRAKLDEGDGLEALCGMALPWLGMGALTLLPWQNLQPMWAAAATAVLALAAFAVAVRRGLQPLISVSYGMQALAVASFIATLHQGSGDVVLDNGVQGALAACLIALCVLACVGYSMVQLHRAALARSEVPQWSLGNQLAAVIGVGLLHLAMLFQISLEQAAFLWPLTACAVLWVALRLVHPALALQAAALSLVSAALYLAQRPEGGLSNLAQWPAFGHGVFWTPVVLGLSALLCGDWLNRHAERVRWCQLALVRWVPLIWGLLWWLQGMLDESTRVLVLHHRADYAPAAWLAVVLATSALALLVAQRRQWQELGRATLGTLVGMVLVALTAASWTGAHSDGTLATVQGYVPSSGLGWLLWPLAALWHLRLLKAQRAWFGESVLGMFHTVGLWLLVLLGARQCQWLLEHLSSHAVESGAASTSWQLLGWVLVPALTLWALQLRAVCQRWPVQAYRYAYVNVAATPMAAYLLLWAWVTNATSAGYAAPLPYVPLLNPLELAQWLVLAAVLLWWRTLPIGTLGAVSETTTKVVLGGTGFALLTGMVLRSCHHYADVPWDAHALYASRLTQAALSVTWALCGVLAMVLGHRLLARRVWMAGAALLGLVVVKLFFVELADKGGLFRIVSFLSVGVLLLLVGYFAPVPPSDGESVDEAENDDEPDDTRKESA